MVVDHGPIKYLISKIRYDEQESPKPNSTYLESYLRQHEENKPRLYLRRIQGLESLHSIHDGGLNPFFKDDLKDKDGVYIYESKEDLTVEEEEEKEYEDDFEIRSFVDSNDLETIRKYRNTSFIITGPLVGPRIFQREKASSCQRRNKRIQAEVQDINVICAADTEIEPEAEVADESLEDIAIKKYEEKEEEFGEKVKVDTWKGKGARRICLCNTKKYKVVKGKFGNKSVKIKLTVNRNTRNAAELKQKKKICLCNLAKKIIETTAELTTVQDEDGLARTLTGVLDTLDLNDNVVSNEEPKVTVSSTKVVVTTDVEETEAIAGQKICLCKKRKKNVSVKIIKTARESAAMVDAQTEILDSIEDDKNKLEGDGSEDVEEVLKPGNGTYDDATNEDIQLNDDTANALCEEQVEEKVERSDELLEYVKDGIQNSVDGPQELQVGEDAPKVAHQDIVDNIRSSKRRKRVCVCNRKIKNVAINITRTTASGWAIETEDSIGLNTGEKVEEMALDRSHMEANNLEGIKETKTEEYLSIAKSLRKKRICLCERRLKSVAIKIIRRTSEPSSMKYLQVFKRQRMNKLKKLEYRKQYVEGGNDEEIGKIKWHKKKKKVCFCDFRLESIDEETHVKEEIPGPIEGTDSIEEQLQANVLANKAGENSLHEILNPAEGSNKIEDQSQVNILSTEIAQNSLPEIFVTAEGPINGTEGKSQLNIASIEVNDNNKVEKQPQEVRESGLQERIEAAEESTGTKATSKANILATIVNEDSLEDIQFSSKMVRVNDGNEINRSTMIKNQSAIKERFLSKDHKPKKILISTDNLGTIEFNKIPEQLKLGSGTAVGNISKTKKSKQNKKVCFCEEPLKEEILEKAGDMSGTEHDCNRREVSSDTLNKRNKVDRDNEDNVKPRRKKKSVDKPRVKGKEAHGILIRERYIAKFSYEKYQEIHEFVNEILEGAFIKFKEIHKNQGKKYIVDLSSKRVSAGKLSDKIKEASEVKCIQKQCKGTVNGETSKHSQKPETMNKRVKKSNKGSISDRNVKQEKKACRCDCNSPETIFYNSQSLIGLNGSNKLLSQCNEQDVRKFKEAEYKVLYVSDLKPITEESNEEEDKPDHKNWKSKKMNSIKQKYKSSTDDTRAGRKKETREIISNCYKDAICNRVSSVILLDPVKYSIQSTGQKVLNDRTLDLLKKGASKEANKGKQRGLIYEKQGEGITVDEIHQNEDNTGEKASLMMSPNPDRHLENSKEACTGDGVRDIRENLKKSKLDQNVEIDRSLLPVPPHLNKDLSSSTKHVRKLSDTRDIKCTIEECRENEFLRKSSDQDTQTHLVKSITKQLIKGISNHKASNQREKICKSNRNFEKVGILNEPALADLFEPCDHLAQSMEPVSDIYKISQMNRIVDHPSEGILDARISRKPKQRRFIIDKIAKCITDTENQLSKPFRRICTSTENAMSKRASVIKSLVPDQHLSSSAKQINKMYDARVRDSSIKESKYFSRISSQDTQREKTTLVAELTSTEITSGRKSKDQQRKICRNNCQLKEEKVPNKAPSIILDKPMEQSIYSVRNSREVSNISITSDTKTGNLSERRSHQDKQTNKTNIIANQSGTGFTNSETSVQKRKLCINNFHCEESGICNRSSLVDLNDPGASLIPTTEPVRKISNSACHKSAMEHAKLNEGTSDKIKKAVQKSSITRITNKSDTANKIQSKKPFKGSCSLYKNAVSKRTSLVILLGPNKHFVSRSKQTKYIHKAGSNAIITEESKSLSERTSDQEAQTTHRNLFAKQSGTESTNSGPSDQQRKVCVDEEGHICNKSSLVISLYPKKYSVHCTKKVNESSDITVIRSVTNETQRGSLTKMTSDQDTQTKQQNSTTMQLTTDFTSDKMSDEGREVCMSNNSYENVPSGNMTLITEPVSKISGTIKLNSHIKYSNCGASDRRSIVSQQIKQRTSLTKGTNMCSTQAKNELRKLRSSSCSCTEYPICKGRSLIVLLGPGRDSTPEMKEMCGTREMEYVTKGSSREITNGDESDPTRKIYKSDIKCEEHKAVEKSSMTIPHEPNNHLIHSTEKSIKTDDITIIKPIAKEATITTHGVTDEDTQSRQMDLIPKDLNRDFTDRSDQRRKVCRSNCKYQESETSNKPSLIISLDPKNHLVSVMEDAKKISNVTVIKHATKNVQTDFLNKVTSNQNTQTKDGYLIAKQSDEDALFGKIRKEKGETPLSSLLDLNRSTAPSTEYCNTGVLESSTEEPSGKLLSKSARNIRRQEKTRHSDEDITIEEKKKISNNDLSTDVICKKTSFLTLYSSHEEHLTDRRELVATVRDDKEAVIIECGEGNVNRNTSCQSKKINFSTKQLRKGISNYKITNKKMSRLSFITLPESGEYLILSTEPVDEVRNDTQLKPIMEHPNEGILSTDQDLMVDAENGSKITDFADKSSEGILVGEMSGDNSKAKEVISNKDKMNEGISTEKYSKNGMNIRRSDCNFTDDASSSAPSVTELLDSGRNLTHRIEQMRYPCNINDISTNVSLKKINIIAEPGTAKNMETKVNEVREASGMNVDIEKPNENITSESMSIQSIGTHIQCLNYETNPTYPSIGSECVQNFVSVTNTVRQTDAGISEEPKDAAQKMEEVSENVTGTKHDRKISFLSPDGKISVTGNWKGNVAIECLNKRKPTS